MVGAPSVGAERCDVSRRIVVEAFFGRDDLVERRREKRLVAATRATTPIAPRHQNGDQDDESCDSYEDVPRRKEHRRSARGRRGCAAGGATSHFSLGEIRRVRRFLPFVWR